MLPAEEGAGEGFVERDEAKSVLPEPEKVEAPAPKVALVAARH